MPADRITAQSLRTSGAMALLHARVDSNLVRMLGRWRSDAMIRYLHVQAAPIAGRFAHAMIQDITHDLVTLL